MSKKRSHKNTTRLLLTERMKGIQDGLNAAGYTYLARALAGGGGGIFSGELRAAQLINNVVRDHVRAALRRKANRDAR